MLAAVDRVQLAVPDRRAAAAPFTRLLDAIVTSEDAVAPLAARRTTLAAGLAAIELLEPDGAGPIADHLAAAGPGLFAGGFATVDLDALRHRLVERRITFAEADGQLFLAPAATGGTGLRCVLSARRDGPAAPGLITHLYEVTNLVPDWHAAAAHYTELFALTAERFCPIESAEYGYRGTLTMFEPHHLDRIEVITPHDLAKTMGRFMTKRGPSLYMCFAEAPDLAAIRDRLQSHAPHDWTGSSHATVPDTLFIHPRALGGLMMGVSRTTVGWTWSGHPERVIAGR